MVNLHYTISISASSFIRCLIFLFQVSDTFQILHSPKQPPKFNLTNYNKFYQKYKQNSFFLKRNSDKT